MVIPLKDLLYMENCCFQINLDEAAPSNKLLVDPDDHSQPPSDTDELDKPPSDTDDGFSLPVYDSRNEGFDDIEVFEDQLVRLSTI